MFGSFVRKVYIHSYFTVSAHVFLVISGFFCYDMDYNIFRWHTAPDISTQMTGNSVQTGGKT